MTFDQRLEQLFKQLAPDIAAQFRAAIADVVDNAILKQVIEAIQANDVEGAWRALGYSPAVFNPFVNSLADALERGGILMTSSFPRYLTGADGIKAVLRFNVRDPLAEQWLANESSTLITNVEADMRLAVRNTMNAGVRDGRNPRSIALDIVGRIDPTTGKRTGGSLGLGAREEMWSRNARQRLVTLDENYFNMELRDKRFDSTVAAAIRDKRPLPVDIVDRLVDRYRTNALQFRGETVGRTEALAALNHSEWLSTKQAVEAGNLSASAVKRVWDSAGDARVRPSHKALDGQTVGLDEPFVSPDTGARMMHPGDVSLGAPGKETIGCRCRVRTVVDWFAGVK